LFGVRGGGEEGLKESSVWLLMRHDRKKRHFLKKSKMNDVTEKDY
jgi:hypothetical protein